MAINSYLEQALLNLIFNATAISKIADNAASTPYTVLYLSLHTADPGVGGGQTTSEATYTSYARVSINRSNGFTAASGSGPATISPNATISFPACTGGTNTITYVGIGTDSTGAAGHLLWSGAVSPSISVSNGVTPQLTTSSTITLN